MGFGSAFTSAWNKANDAVQQKVAQVVNKAQDILKNAGSQAQAVNKFIENQKDKAKEKAVDIVNQVYDQAKKKTGDLVKKAVAIAKPKIIQLKNKATTAKKVGAKGSKTRRKVKNAFKKIKKAFSAKNLVKAAVQVCPIAKEVYDLRKIGKDELKVLISDTSASSKILGTTSNLIKAVKSADDLFQDSRIVFKAIQYAADNPVVALAKHSVRGVSSVRGVFEGVALDIAIGGLTGGLDTLKKNIDRKDISIANQAGRVGYGILKGASNSVVSAGMGAATGAVIGAVIGSVVPGAGTAAGAVLGAKLGATLLSPLFEKPAEWVTDKIFTEKGEDKAGEFGDKISSAVKGAWTGAINLIRPPNGGGFL